MIISGVWINNIVHLHPHTFLSLIRDSTYNMKIVKFIIACMPLAVLASPIEQHGAELVDREAAPGGWVEVAPFTEKRDDPKELFRRKFHRFRRG